MRLYLLIILFTTINCQNLHPLHPISTKNLSIYYIYIYIIEVIKLLKVKDVHEGFGLGMYFEEKNTDEYARFIEYKIEENSEENKGIGGRCWIVQPNLYLEEVYKVEEGSPITSVSVIGSSIKRITQPSADPLNSSTITILSSNYTIAILYENTRLKIYELEGSDNLIILKDKTKEEQAHTIPYSLIDGFSLANGQNILFGITNNLSPPEIHFLELNQPFVILTTLDLMLPKLRSIPKLGKYIFIPTLALGFDIFYYNSTGFSKVEYNARELFAEEVYITRIICINNTMSEENNTEIYFFDERHNRLYFYVIELPESGQPIFKEVQIIDLSPQDTKIEDIFIMAASKYAERMLMVIESKEFHSVSVESEVEAESPEYWLDYRLEGYSSTGAAEKWHKESKNYTFRDTKEIAFGVEFSGELGYNALHLFPTTIHNLGVEINWLHYEKAKGFHILDSEYGGSQYVLILTPSKLTVNRIQYREGFLDCAPNYREDSPIYEFSILGLSTQCEGKLLVDSNSRSDSCYMKRDFQMEAVNKVTEGEKADTYIVLQIVAIILLILILALLAAIIITNAKKNRADKRLRRYIRLQKELDTQPSNELPNELPKVELAIEDPPILELPPQIKAKSSIETQNKSCVEEDKQE